MDIRSAETECEATRLVEIIVPCLNEESSAPHLLTEIERVISGSKNKNTIRFGIIIVDDGSRDNTADIFRSLLSETNVFARKTVISFSRNFGKEAALHAGLSHCKGSACIFIDADLQDPPSLINNMIDQWLSGSDIVNAVRSERQGDGTLKRITAKLFYQLFSVSSHLDIQFNSSDFRLLNRNVIDAILACPERIRFSKGFFAWVGYKQSNIYFDRPPRMNGQSKWRTWRLWNYALDGIFNFSTAPLRIWGYLGLVVTFSAFVQGLIVVWRTLVFGADIPGYASLFVSVTFLGGIQLLGIGILGEYVGRIFVESKRRPLYLIRNIQSIPLCTIDR